MKPRDRLLLATLLASLLASTTALADQCSKAAPGEVQFASGSGAVNFPHEQHAEDMEIPCEDCHHETAASTLEMPHPEYFEDFWIRCETCHRSAPEPGCPQDCSPCHHGSPASIADESLSSKVVIHKTCWACHPVGTGAEASQGCDLCHQDGTRSDAE